MGVRAVGSPVRADAPSGRVPCARESSKYSQDMADARVTAVGVMLGGMMTGAGDAASAILSLVMYDPDGAMDRCGSYRQAHHYDKAGCQANTVLVQVTELLTPQIYKRRGIWKRSTLNV